MNRFVRLRHLPLAALTLQLAVFCASAVPIARTIQPFSDYQPILDRMPFGTAVPAAATVDPALAQNAAQVQAEQQKLAQKISMSCVNITPEGTTAIGFTDLSDKTPVNYYLLVGATGGGWSVLAADYDDEWAQIKKDDVTITLKLGKGLIDAPPVRAAAANALADQAQPAPTNAASRVGLALRPSLLGRPSANLAGLQRGRTAMDQVRDEMSKTRDQGEDIKSYMERLRERKQQQSAAEAANEQGAREQLQELAKKITQDELAKKEREENLKLIEQGDKPSSAIEAPPEENQAPVEKGDQP